MRLSLLVTVVGLFAFVAGGCTVSSKPVTQMNSKEFSAFVVQNEGQVRIGARNLTQVVLLTIEDKDERAKVGRFAHEMASAVNAAVARDSVDLSKMRLLSMDLIAKSDLKHKELVGYLVGSCADLVELQLSNAFAEATPETKRAAARSFIRGVSQGVLDVTAPYAAPGPTTSPAPVALLEPRIDMRWFRPVPMRC